MREATRVWNGNIFCVMKADSSFLTHQSLCESNKICVCGNQSCTSGRMKAEEGIPKWRRLTAINNIISALYVQNFLSIYAILL